MARDTLNKLVTNLGSLCNFPAYVIFFFPVSACINEKKKKN